MNHWYQTVSIRIGWKRSINSSDVPTLPWGPWSPPPISMPPPYGIIPLPRKFPPKDFPDSISWNARYWRIDSGISQPSPVSILFFAKSFILARLFNLGQYDSPSLHKTTYRFWNQICTDRSVMLISSAIRSLTVAVGVGFLLNSTSRVTSWSWVALWRFWFFCCCVNVLLRGGLREAELLPADIDAVGEGVDDILIASSCDMSDILISKPLSDVMRCYISFQFKSNL